MSVYIDGDLNGGKDSVLFCITLHKYHRRTVRTYNDIVMMFPKRESSEVSWCDSGIVTSQTHQVKDKRLSEPCTVNSDNDYRYSLFNVL